MLAGIPALEIISREWVPHDTLFNEYQIIIFQSIAPKVLPQIIVFY